MTTKDMQPAGCVFRISAGIVLVALLGGCVQTAPVVVENPDEQILDRMVFVCPNDRRLEVSRMRDRAAILVNVDGNATRLPRQRIDPAATAERYADRMRALTISGNVATYESMGRIVYGPCNAQESDGPNRGRRRSTRPEDVD